MSLRQTEAITPMLASTIDIVPTGPDWVLERKLDGWRCVATSDGDGVLLHTRERKPITSVPYIQTALAFLPPGSKLDGEILDLHGDTEWNRTQQILSRHAEHIPGDDSPVLTYVIFDVLQLGDKDLTDLPLSTRRTVLEDVIEPHLNATCLKLIEQHDSTPEAMDKLVREGAEGAVVKHRNGTYRVGKRAKDWCKLKPKQTIDAVITGTFPAIEGSKYDGNAVGGMTFQVTYEDGTIVDGQCAGMRDEVRRDLYVNPQDYIGRMIEVQHGGISTTDSRALRFPRFKRFRYPEDKGSPIEMVHNTPAVAPPLLGHDAAPPAQMEMVANGPASARTAPSTPQTTAPRKRNYAAMGEAKLLRVCAELETGGDAAQRAEDPMVDLELVHNLIRERGL
jgi:ATP-dependent DNA ligase